MEIFQYCYWELHLMSNRPATYFETLGETGLTGCLLLSRSACLVCCSLEAGWMQQNNFYECLPEFELVPFLLILFLTFCCFVFFFFPREVCVHCTDICRQNILWGYSKFIYEYILYTAINHFRKQSMGFHTTQAQQWLDEWRWTGWWNYVQLHFMNEKRENKSHHFRHVASGKSSSSKVPLGFQSATIPVLIFLCGRLKALVIYSTHFSCYGRASVIRDQVSCSVTVVASHNQAT